MIKTWKIVLALAGIFVAGAVTGAFVFMRFGQQWLIHRPGPDQWAPNHLKRLVDRLGLQPDQVERIRPIVRRNMEELNRLRVNSMTETRTIFQRMEQEISVQLTPEQRTKFDQMNKEFRERARRFMGDRPNRPGGPGGPRPEKERHPGGPDEPPPGGPPPEKPPGGN